MSKKYAIMIIIVSCILVIGANGFTEDEKIQYKDLKDAEGLSGETKQTVIESFKNINCYAGCPDTVYNCLIDEPQNKSVKRLANFIIRRAKAHRSVEEIKSDVKERAVSLYPPKTHKIDITGKQVSGSKDAAITVVAFADGECPYCRIASPALRKISQQKQGLIAYYFKQFPLKSHKHGLDCAKSLVAAEMQNKLWQLHDIIYKNVEHLTNDDLKKYAATIGLNMEKYEKDRNSDKVLDIIRKDKSDGVALNVVGTPGIFINGKFYKGLKTYEELLDIIEEEKDIVDGLQ